MNINFEDRQSVFYHEEIQCERNAGVFTWNIVTTMYMFLIGWYEIVNTNSSLNFVNVDAKMPENKFLKNQMFYKVNITGKKIRVFLITRLGVD